MDALEISSNGTHIVSGYQAVHVNVGGTTTTPPAPSLQQVSIVAESPLVEVKSNSATEGFYDVKVTIPPTLLYESRYLPMWIYNGSSQQVVITLLHNGQSSVVVPMNLQYSADMETWTPFASSGVGIRPNSYLFFRASRDGGESTVTQFSDMDSYFTFKCDDYKNGQVYVGGNILSLTTFNDISDGTSLSVSDASFYYLFAGSSFNFDYLTEISVNNVGSFGFYRMFYNCTTLEQSPDFIVQGTIGSDGIGHTFENCTSLRAINLYNVTSLTTANAAGILTGTTKGALFIQASSEITVGSDLIPAGWTVIQN